MNLAEFTRQIFDPQGEYLTHKAKTEQADFITVLATEIGPFIVRNSPKSQTMDELKSISRYESWDIHYYIGTCDVKADKVKKNTKFILIESRLDDANDVERAIYVTDDGRIARLVVNYVRKEEFAYYAESARMEFLTIRALTRIIAERYSFSRDFMLALVELLKETNMHLTRQTEIGNELIARLDACRRVAHS